MTMENGRISVSLSHYFARVLEKVLGSLGFELFELGMKDSQAE